MSRKARVRKKLRAIADRADAALNRLKEAFAAMTENDAAKISSSDQRQAWSHEQMYKTSGIHHHVTALEAADIFDHLGGEDFADAVGCRLGAISKGGTFALPFGREFKGTLDGHDIGMIDILPVGEFAYDLRILAKPEDTQTIPDGLFIAGLRIIKTIPALALENLRTALDENGIRTELDITTAAQNVIDMCIEHTTKCDCEGCKEVVAQAARENRPLIEVIADTSPVVKMALEAVKHGSVSTADKVTATDASKASEPLSSIVESIKRAALEGTDVDEQAQERIREAFKRSLVVVPDKQTVN